MLVSGGVGLTPLVSMLKALAHRGANVPVYFVHGSRNSGTHALGEEVRRVAAERPNVRAHIRYNEPRPGDVESGRCDAAGVIDVPLLEELVPGLDGDFYLCGPKPFMACLYHGLMGRGVPDDRIHFEFFGPKQDLVLAAAGAPETAASA